MSLITIIVCCVDHPESPQNVVANEVTQNTLSLIWLKPHDNYAPIIGYYVMYMRAGFETNVVNTSVESANISDLVSGTLYSLNVTAFNEVGVSDPSNPLTVETLGNLGE